MAEENVGEGSTTPIRKHLQKIGSKGGKTTAKKHAKKLAKWGRQGARAANRTRATNRKKKAA